MFKIQVNQGFIAQHQMTKEVAKPAAREILREKSAGAIVEIGREERDFVKNAHYKFPQEAIKNAQMYKKQYEKFLPEKLESSTESQMWIRAKQLKDDMTHGMLSREELHPVKGFEVQGKMNWVVDEEKIRSNDSVKRELAWQKKNESNIQEFKKIMRHLDPDNPNAGDVEKWRPKLRGVR